MTLSAETQLLLGTICWGLVMIWVPIIGAMGVTKLLAAIFNWRVHERD